TRTSIRSTVPTSAKPSPVSPKFRTPTPVPPVAWSKPPTAALSSPPSRSKKEKNDTKPSFTDRPTADNPGAKPPSWISKATDTTTALSKVHLSLSKTTKFWASSAPTKTSSSKAAPPTTVRLGALPPQWASNPAVLPP